MYARTLRTQRQADFGGVLNMVDIAGVLRWDPANRVLRVSVRFGGMSEGAFLSSSRPGDSFEHTFSPAAYSAVTLVPGPREPLQGMWTRMYDALGADRADLTSS